MMDDVKHVILRFQDQKLLDEQAADCNISSDVSKEESVENDTEDKVSPSAGRMTTYTDHGHDHHHQQQQQQICDDVELHSTATSGQVIGRHKLTGQGLKEVPSMLQVVAVPIKLPLQTISDRMNWCPEYQLNVDAMATMTTTSLVPSSGEQSLVLSGSRWFADLLPISGFIGQNMDVASDTVSELSTTDVTVEVDENNSAAAATPTDCWCTIPAAGYCCHSSRHHVTGNGSGLGDDDREVCAAFSAQVVAQPRCRFMRHPLVPCPLSVTAYRALCRSSVVTKSARWNHQHMPRPSLDFNKMQKTCLKGRVRRKERRRMLRYLERLRYRQQTIRLFQRLTDGRRTSTTSSITSSPDVMGYTESTQRHEKPQPKQQQQQSASYVDQDTDGARIGHGVNVHLDPAVFRFRSIWFDAVAATAAADRGD